MTIDENKKTAMIKIASGAFLVIAGLLGSILGKNFKQRTLRLSVLAMSIISMGVGSYFLISGSSDLALGVAGNYQMGGPAQQPIVFPGPNFFEMSLQPLRKQQPDLRRLKYACPDGSEEFTVYMTQYGVFGIPKKDITCRDGFRLLSYDPSRGYVIEKVN